MQQSCLKMRVSSYFIVQFLRLPLWPSYGVKALCDVSVTSLSWLLCWAFLSHTASLFCAVTGGESAQAMRLSLSRRRVHSEPLMEYSMYRESAVTPRNGDRTRSVLLKAAVTPCLDEIADKTFVLGKNVSYLAMGTSLSGKKPACQPNWDASV